MRRHIISTDSSNVRGKHRPACGAKTRAGGSCLVSVDVPASPKRNADAWFARPGCGSYQRTAGSALCALIEDITHANGT